MNVIFIDENGDQVIISIDAFKAEEIIRGTSENLFPLGLKYPQYKRYYMDVVGTLYGYCEEEKAYIQVHPQGEVERVRQEMIEDPDYKGWITSNFHVILSFDSKKITVAGWAMTQGDAVKKAEELSLKRLNCPFYIMKVAACVQSQVVPPTFET